ncbi:MAG: transglycosylase SLT domain-containing protein [Pseudomonadota bacterium]
MRRMLFAGLTLVCVAGPALAEVKRLQPDFTFRRVTVPSAGSTGPRINVQVAPKPDVTPAAAATPDPGPDVSAPAAPWFWDSVSPELTASSPGRLEDALNVIANPPSGGGVSAPRLQTLQDIAQAHGADILRETVGKDVSPALVVALIAVESAGQVQVESSAGAVGLMQLMPATAERFGVTERANPSQNIKGGVAYLSWLLSHFDNDPILALAGYNAGEGAVRSNSGVPPYSETRNYVPKVLAAFQVAKGLCQTPPELVSDGCVFAVSNIN